MEVTCGHGAEELGAVVRQVPMGTGEAIRSTLIIGRSLVEKWRAFAAAGGAPESFEQWP